MFVTVAQQLNFTRAAETLGVSAGAVSRQIQALEEYLGRPLLERGATVSLTAAGARLLPKLQSALEDLDLAIQDSRVDRDSDVLSVTTIASFLQQWLLARLPRFRQRHPRISITIHTSSTLADFSRTGHHVGLRFSEQSQWPGLHAQKLFDEWLVPVCTPALLKKFGSVDDPANLKRHSLLHCRSEPWSLWAARSVPTATMISRQPGTEVDASGAVVLSAMRGEGLALARWSLAADEVAAGTLAVACSSPLPFTRAYWFICPRRVMTMPSLEAFRHWLFTEAAAFPAPPGANQALSTRTAPKFS